MIKALLECDSLGQVRMKELLEYSGGQKLKPPEVDITDNVLTATAKTDSMAIYLQLKERYEEKEKIREVFTQTIVEVNVLTRWQKIRLYLANTILLLLPVIIYFKIPSIKQWVRTKLKRN